MKHLVFISLILGIAYVAYLQSTQVKKYDLDKAQNKVEQTKEEVNKIMDSHQDSLDKNLSQ